jgi:molybdenum cofactor synthesis domain-containing protein
MKDKTQIRAVAITVSDSRSKSEQEDVSGKVLVECLREIGAEVVSREIVSDDLGEIVTSLSSFASRDDVNLIVTTGGTGIFLRDNTPEATRRVIEKEIPGMSEAMRMKSLEITDRAMLARGVCGIRGKCLIVNLPGSPKGVRECFEIIAPVLQHTVDLLAGDTKH